MTVNDPRADPNLRSWPNRLARNDVVSNRFSGNICDWRIEAQRLKQRVA